METSLLCELLSRLRRQFDRYQFHVDVELEWRGRKLWGHVKDINREEMFIELDNPPRAGSTFVVRLALNEPLRLDCVVQYVTPGQGAGVAISAAEGDRRRFEALLIALSPSADMVSAGATPPKAEQPHQMLN